MVNCVHQLKVATPTTQKSVGFTLNQQKMQAKVSPNGVIQPIKTFYFEPSLSLKKRKKLLSGDSTIDVPFLLMDFR